MGLEQVIVSMVEMFEEFAGQEGKKTQINMADFRRIIEEELNKPELKDKIHPEDVNEALQMMDKNHDGDVNFREFSRCVTALAKGYYKQKRGKGGKRGKGKEGEQED